MKLANIAKLATAGVGLSTLTINSAAFAASGINFGTVNTQIAGTTENADTAITTIFNNAALFIFLIAVCYGVYGGYLYLTASGEEEQTKKAKVIFKQVAIGILIIFLAYSIVTTVLGTLFGQTGDSGSSLKASTK